MQTKKLSGIKKMLSRDEMKQIKGGSGLCGETCWTFYQDVLNEGVCTVINGTCDCYLAYYNFNGGKC